MTKCIVRSIGLLVLAITLVAVSFLGNQPVLAAPLLPRVTLASTYTQRYSAIEISYLVY